MPNNAVGPKRIPPTQKRGPPQKEPLKIPHQSHNPKILEKYPLCGMDLGFGEEIGLNEERFLEALIKGSFYRPTNPPKGLGTPSFQLLVKEYIFRNNIPTS